MNKKFCKNCFLFDKKKLECQVVVIIDGQKLNMPTLPEDECHFEKLDIQIKPWDNKHDIKKQ